jgi:hypothetical protein
LTKVYSPDKVTLMINIDTTTEQLDNQINDRLYCDLIDMGIDPKIAYKEAFESDFDLEVDVQQLPGLEEDPVDALLNDGHVDFLLNTVQ